MAAVAEPPPGGVAGADVTRPRGGAAAAGVRPRGHVGPVLQDVFSDLFPSLDSQVEPQAEAAEALAEDAEEAGDGEASQQAQLSADTEVDVAGEDSEIAAIRTGIDEEQRRLHEFMEHLDERHVEGLRQDTLHAEEIKKAWGLVVGEHIPVPESKLNKLLHPSKMGKEGLVLPRHMMEEVERWIEIKKGTIPQHDNLLALSKPDEPNHYKDTASLNIRAGARNIQPRLTDGQRSLMSTKLEQRRAERPPAPPALNGEEQERNKKLLRHMLRKINFLKNPRFVTDRSAEKGDACPFWFSSEQVTFRDYQVGGVYEVSLEFKNATKVGRRLRVLPCASASFSLGPMRYEGDGAKGLQPHAVIAPGMSAHVKLRFAPNNLNDESDALTVQTEFGDYKLPVCSRRVQPQLVHQDPVNCGCILAGGSTSTSVQIRNVGGEGSFRLIQPGTADDDGSCYYETREDGETTLVSRSFSFCPASFYLDAHQSVDVRVTFRSPDVGKHRFPLLIECDNGKSTPISFVAIADALRLEMSSWPGVQRPLKPAAITDVESPWSLQPWQLNWLRPGVQVGFTDAQSIVVSNGGNLPASVEWRLVCPSARMVSLLSCGGQQRLNDDTLKDIHSWTAYGESELGSAACPFRISPATATIPPFSTAKFTFYFTAHVPTAHRATSFAYLVAHNVPSSGSCLLHYRRLLDLKDLGEPESYARGLPMFGGAVSGLFEKAVASKADALLGIDSGPPLDFASCTVSAICLQGLSAGPSLSCVPRLVSLAGAALPFLSYTREVLLRNSGQRPAAFRVRLASRSHLEANHFDPLWVVSLSEAGVASRNTVIPAVPTPAAEFVASLEKTAGAHLGLKVTSGDRGSLVVQGVSSGLAEAWNADNAQARVTPGDEVLDVNGTRVDPVDFVDMFKSLPDGSRFAIRLRRGRRGHMEAMADRFASEWVPLPPDNDSSLPGYGAVCTAAVFPDIGTIGPGQTVKLTLAVRAPREADLNAHFYVDFPLTETSDVQVAPPIKVNVSAWFRSPRAELRGTNFLDYGVVRAYARHTTKLRLDNPSDLPMLARVRPFREGQDESECFLLKSHQDVVSVFMASLGRGGDAGFDEFLEGEPTEVVSKPWVHSRGGCLDKSGRHKFSGGSHKVAEDEHKQAELRGGIEDSAAFVFKPSCVIIWPRQSVELDVTLRTGKVGKFRAMLEAVGFNSCHTQCLEVTAEVQLPQLRLSTQNLHFPITYLKTPTDKVKVHLRNDSDMLATFKWDVPLKMESGIEVLIEPQEGEVRPRGQIPINVIAIPTKVMDFAVKSCRVFVGELLQPLILQTSATVYGLEVDYAVVPDGELVPEIIHQPRSIGEGNDALPVSFPVATGRAPKSSAIVDFGEMELQKSRTVQLVLYNRSGIATPWSISVDKYPAYDPLLKGRSIGGLLDAATRMYSMCVMPSDASPGGGEPGKRQSALSFQAEPQPASQGCRLSTTDQMNSKASTIKHRGSVQSGGRAPSSKDSKFDPRARTSGKAMIRKPKRFLLDDKHEKQAFRSNVGAEFAKLKEIKAGGAVALHYGHGWAVRLEPGNDWLQPFGQSVVTLTCFSDLPGLMEDELIVKVRDLEGHSEGGMNFRIPMRLLSKGNPLFLPDQQVGLCKELDPPQLSCGTMVPAEKVLKRTFRVSNNSAAKMRLGWTVYGKSQVDHKAENRKYVKLAICKKKGIEDPLKAVLAAGEDDEESEEDDINAESDEEEPPFKFQMWTAEPPKVKDAFALPLTGDLPLLVEPAEAVLAPHGSATFTVSLLASRATASADGHYHYKLVGKGRFTEDRKALLAAVAVSAAEGDKDTTQRPSRGSQVRDLPSFSVDALDADDSDAEDSRRQDGRAQMTLLPESGADVADGNATRIHSKFKPLEDVPEHDVVSTLVLDCVGDVIIPRLTVDKKDDPSVEDHPVLDPSELALDGTKVDEPRHCAVFKFTHSVVPHPAVARQQLAGTCLGGEIGGAQIPGIVSNVMRNVSLTNRNSCGLYCRFRVDGPFRIIEVAQVGKYPVKFAEPLGASPNKTRKGKVKPQSGPTQMFQVDKSENINIQVEFVPDFVPAADWKQDRIDNVFEGDLTIEYPREAAEATDVPTDLQRIRMVATSRKPALRAIVIPVPHLDLPPVIGVDVGAIMVDFGKVHVDTSLARKRVVLLLNMTNVLARWTLLHNTRKGVTKDDQSADERDVFHFDTSSGSIRGPSKDGLVPGSPTRMPKWFPSTAALPKRFAAADEHLFEPTKVTVTFQPTQNLLYSSRFRFEVENGINVDIICRGTGSYDEQDDCMDFREA